jgi:hypothetical protein
MAQPSFARRDCPAIRKQANGDWLPNCFARSHLAYFLFDRFPHRCQPRQSLSVVLGADKFLELRRGTEQTRRTEISRQKGSDTFYSLETYHQQLVGCLKNRQSPDVWATSRVSRHLHRRGCKKEIATVVAISALDGCYAWFAATLCPFQHAAGWFGTRHATLGRAAWLRTDEASELAVQRTVINFLSSPPGLHLGAADRWIFNTSQLLCGVISSS